MKTKITVSKKGSISDEFNEPIRAIFHNTYRVLCLRNDAEVDKYRGEAAIVITEILLLGNENLVVEGRVYNFKNAVNGTVHPLQHIREIEMSRGEIFKIEKISVNKEELEIHGIVPEHCYTRPRLAPLANG